MPQSSVIVEIAKEELAYADRQREKVATIPD
jgi:hypothetical protein